MDVPPAASPKRGRGPMIWVIAAIAVGGCCVLILPAVLLPVFVQAKENKARSDCSHYMRQMGETMSLYAADFDDHLPPADWMDSTYRHMPREKFLHCPAVGTDEYGYALNDELVGRSRSEIKDANTPMAQICASAANEYAWRLRVWCFRWRRFVRHARAPTPDQRTAGV